MRRLIEEYNTNSEGSFDIMAISMIILYWPAILLDTSPIKIVRFLGVLLSIPNFVILSPILLPMVMIGFIQFMWREA